ncbi:MULTISPECIES: BTAD domain-containing putative transcriptional regulator [unclassified Nocardia]|uniref:BTAD domain-containing putative transcriptional regulator n=1 Tax=unclassified Nocardia TaxID=2637762 RepID=UPI001CE44D99|nr:MULTISPECIES: BTAD domain-containing putative transcriptional regulator [unclassified Nocardia]
MTEASRNCDKSGSAEFCGPHPVEIRLLGRFAVVRDGVPVAPRLFGGRQARRLLRLLAVRRGTLVSKGVAAEALWPGKQPADPVGNVEILVSRIRTALGDRTLVETGPAGYTLVGDDRIRVDTETFLSSLAQGHLALAQDPAAALAALTAGLRIWRGDPLTEDADAEWAREHRRLLCDKYLQALEDTAAAALAIGDAATAAAWARTATERQPFREGSALLLVRALAAAGDRACALEEFDRFRIRLVDELGVDPSAEAMALRQRILCDELPHTAEPDVPQRDSGRRAEVLALLAVANQPVPATLLASTLDAELRSALAELAVLHESQLVRADRDGWRIASPALESEIRDGIEPATAMRLHLLFAEALHRRGGDPGAVAAHLAAGGDDQRATSTYITAAEERLRCVSDDDALRYAEAGLALPVRGTHRAALLAVRAEAHRRRGALDAARTDLRAALDETTVGVHRSRLLSRLAILETRSRATALGEQLAELAVAEAGDDPAARGQALAAAAIIDLTLPNFQRARRRFRRARQLLELGGDPNGAARVVYWRSMANFMTGRIMRAERHLDALVDLPLLPDELLRLWNPRAARGYLKVLMAQPHSALVDIEAALAWAAAVDHPVVRCCGLRLRGEASIALGDLDRALEDAQTGLAIAQHMGHAEETAAALRTIGMMWQARAELDRAEQAFRASLDAARAVPLYAGWAAARLGLVLVRQGRHAEAAPLIEDAVQHRIPLVRHEGRWAYAELLSARKDAAARTVARDALDTARSSGHLALVRHLAELAEAG